MPKLKATELLVDGYDSEFLIKGTGHSVEAMADAVEWLTGGQVTVLPSDDIRTGYYRWVPDREENIIRLYRSKPGRGAFLATIISQKPWPLPPASQ